MNLRTPFSQEAYLAPSPMVDWEHPGIQGWVADYRPQGRPEEEVVRDAFEFVRDRISHSWDVGSRRVTAKASEVLQYEEGICYAKSLLLAALLRAMRIPAGLCYQKLTLGDTPESGYCVHGLNAIYLTSVGRWVRLDARGNKPGVDAQFSLTQERLAFPVRPEYGEWDYETNCPEPPPVIVESLTGHDDCLVLCNQHLPTDL